MTNSFLHNAQRKRVYAVTLQRTYYRSNHSFAERGFYPEIYKKWVKYFSDITKNPTHCIEYFNINVMGFDQVLLIVISNQICLHS